MTLPRTPLCLALLAIFPLLAQASDNTPVNAAGSGSTAATSSTASGSSANAASPDADASPAASTDNARTLQAISVVGQSETRQVQQLDKAQIQAQPPGTNPLQMLQKLPGVNFTSDDPFGNDEWSSRITLRGFDHTELGYTLDGVPLGNNDFHTGDGMTPTRAWIPENLGELELAQGSSALGTASSSNLGGTVQLRTADPNPVAGVRLNATGGSYGFQREYIRVDTGKLGGFSGYLSGMFTDAPLWKGHDEQRQAQINAKGVYQWSGGSITGIVDAVRRVEQPYIDMSKNSLARCGYKLTYLEPDWGQALAIANGHYSGCITNPDDTYYGGNELRRDLLSSVKGQFFLSDSLTLNVQPYYHYNRSQGHWFAPQSDLPYTVAPGDAPIALRLSHYLLTRGGLISSLAYDVGNNHLEGGFWFEDSQYTIGRSFEPISASGGPISQNVMYNTWYNALFLQRFVTHTRQWYLQDSWTSDDGRLELNGGFKGHNINTDAVALLPGRASGDLATKSAFLPQLGANYKLGGGFETFASFQMSQNAYEPGANGAWSSTQATFDALKNSLHPERSNNSELGLRYVAPSVQTSLALYHIDFKDRLLVITPCAGVVSCPNQIANVGRVKSQGAEYTFVWQPTENLQWFNSATYNSAHYENNYVNGTLVEVKGKTVVDSPKKMLSSEITYKFGGDFTAKLGAKFTGRRYYTYTNDQDVGGFTLWDAGLSWERKDLSFAKDLKVSLTVSNLLNKKYIATVGSNGYADSDPSGSFATLLPGAPREGFLSVDLGF